MATDDDSPWSRQLLVGLGALVAVALIVGGVMSVVVLGAAKVTGIGEAGPGASAKPSLYLPDLSDTPTPQSPDSSAPAPVESTSPASPSPSPTTEKPPQQITLQASPQQVSPGARIDLSGVYPRGEGASLRVQRWEGGWQDFGVSASVSGGVYNTWIMTSRTGKQRLRVLDPSTGKHSNEVKVTVG